MIIRTAVQNSNSQIHYIVFTSVQNDVRTSDEAAKATAGE